MLTSQADGRGPSAGMASSIRLAVANDVLDARIQHSPPLPGAVEVSGQDDQRPVAVCANGPFVVLAFQNRHNRLPLAVYVRRQADRAVEVGLLALQSPNEAVEAHVRARCAIAKRPGGFPQHGRICPAKTVQSFPPRSSVVCAPTRRSRRAPETAR